MNAAFSRSAFQRTGRLVPVFCLAALAVTALATAAVAAEGEEPDTQPEPPPRHAFKLGEFRIKNYRPIQREQVKLQFTVYVEADEGQQEMFQAVWRNHQHRVRNQVITAARLVPPDEFEDPKLQALRRRIYLRLRRAVPELPIDKVFISDFSYLLE